MRSLRGRIGLALLVFGSTTLIVVGSSLWFSLRDLHREAAQASLAELTVPYASQARLRFPDELLRPRQRDELSRREVVERFRESQAGRRAAIEFTRFVQETQEEIDEAGISVLLVSDDTAVVRDPDTAVIESLAEAPDVSVPERRGEVATGTTTVDGLGDVLYAATPVRDPSPERAIPALVLVREDDSASLATGDLVRTLTVAALFLIVIGIPLAAGLSASVTRPLRRLAAASDTVARGEVPEALPTTGPLEVADASAAFNAMAAEVDATRETQRQLLADIRHDLRTPLTVIAGFSEALKDGTATGETADRAASAIADEAERLERMLSDLDHLTGPDASGPPLRLEMLDVREVATAAVDRFGPEAEIREQSLTLDDAAVAVRLVADRDALDRILGNLVANALAHAPSPDGCISIEVSVDEGTATLSVRDDGPGIPSRALPHVFDRFYRADPSRSEPGAGLGLAIVRDLADALGGSSFAENLDGVGARVGVRLPVSPSGELAGAS